MLKNEKASDLSLEHLRQIKPIFAGEVFKELKEQILSIDKNALFKYLYLDEYFIEELLTIADVREVVDEFRPSAGPVIYYIYDGLVNVFDSKTNQLLNQSQKGEVFRLDQEILNRRRYKVYNPVN